MIKHKNLKEDLSKGKIGKLTIGETNKSFYIFNAIDDNNTNMYIYHNRNDRDNEYEYLTTELIK